MNAASRLRELRGSIALRLVLFTVAVVSLTAGLFGSLAYVRAGRALEREAKLRLMLSAQSIADRLELDLADRVADVEGWSRLDAARSVNDSPRGLAQLVEQKVQGPGGYLGVACFDRNGREVAAAGEERGRAGPARPGPTRLGVLLEEEAGRGLFRIDAPILDPRGPGPPLGTLVALVDPLQLLRTGKTRPRTLRAQGSLTLRDDRGRTVVRIDPRPSAARGGVEERAAPAAAVLTGAATLRPIPGTEGPALEVVVGESAALALASVRKLPAKLVKIALLSLVLASALGALLAWRISAPIRRLTTAVRRIGERGRIDSPVELPAAAGEVGVLSSVFAAMMGSVAAAQAESLVRSRLAFLGEIAAHVAHDIRTPLTVLKTSAHLLARPQVDADERRELARSIEDEVDRLNRAVTGLVEIARPASDPVRPRAIAPILERAVSFFRPLAGRSGVRIELAAEDRGALVVASEDRLYQVFLNLIHNALQAVGGPGVVSVRCFAERRSVVIEVADNGPGLAPEVAAKLFSPYVTTKPQGVGLGLVISRRIVEEHGGTIEGENAPGGRGALFRIRLPRSEDGE